MQLTAQARVYLPGQDVFRKPTFWDKVKNFTGSDIDLRTGESRLTADALALTELVQQALWVAGIKNAVSLVVDRDVVYHDTDGLTNDAELLVDAMRRCHDRFAAGHQILRAVFEHQEGGLHSLIEVTVRSVHDKQEAAAVVAVGSRIEALRPRDGESLDAAKERIGKALADTTLVPTSRALLDGLMERIRKGLATAFPLARVEVDAASASLERPSGQALRQMHGDRDRREAELRDQPAWDRARGPYYDPWGVYYHDPMNTFVNLMIIDSLLHPHVGWGYGPGFLGSSWSHYGAPVTIVNNYGSPIASADQVTDGQLGNLHNVADSDFSTASWDDRALASYDAAESSWTSSGGGGADYDCVGGDSGGDSSGNSWDCAADYSADCTSDCSWDCSSDCSWDCGGDS
jgi:hypothetical protein